MVPFFDLLSDGFLRNLVSDKSRVRMALARCLIPSVAGAPTPMVAKAPPHPAHSAFAMLLTPIYDI